MADEEEEDVCDICFESFKSPKLLPCRHTFCEPCLSKYGKVTCPADRNEFLVCPLCRTQCVLPSGGVESFVNNYFVKDSLASDRSVSLYKDYPKCNFCKAKLLSDDSSAHTCRLSSELSPDDNDDVDDTYNDTSLGFIIRFPLLRMRTKFKVDLQSSITLARNVEDALVTCIRITPENVCYSVLNCMNSYGKHDAKGKVIGSITITPYTAIMDMVYRKDGSVLFLTGNEICRVENGSRVLLHKKINVPNALAMALFSDERVVVVGCTSLKVETLPKPGEQTEDKKPDEKAPEPVKKGWILVLSRDGKKVLSELSRENSHPCAVAVSPVSDVVCMSDSLRKLVSVFLPSGDVIGEFKLDNGGLGFLSFLRFLEPEQNTVSELHPAGVCFDPNGNIVVVDQGSASVLVLSASAEFMGMLMTGAEGGFGRPFLVGCGPDGNIWIGNGGTINVYRIATYTNSM